MKMKVARWNERLFGHSQVLLQLESRGLSGMIHSKLSIDEVIMFDGMEGTAQDLIEMRPMRSKF